VLSTVYGDVDSRLLENERWAQKSPATTSKCWLFQSNFFFTVQRLHPYMSQNTSELCL